MNRTQAVAALVAGLAIGPAVGVVVGATLACDRPRPVPAPSVSPVPVDPPDVVAEEGCYLAGWDPKSPWCIEATRLRGDRG